MTARMMNMVMAIAVLLLGPPGTTGCGGGTGEPGNTQQPVIGDPYQSACLDTFDGESDGTVEVLVEEFDYKNPVDCYCTQQAAILVAGVPPGSYTLKIYDNDRQRLLVEEPVTVP